LLGHADDGQFLTFFQATTKSDRAVEVLKQRIEQAESQDPTALNVRWNDFEFRRASDARRIANWVIALVKLGETDILPEYLRASEDPTIASWIFTRMSDYAVDITVITDLLRKESDSSVIRSLLLALGYYEYESIPPSLQDPTAIEVARLTRLSSAPGVQSAARWTMDRWNLGTLASVGAEVVAPPWQVTSPKAGLPFGLEQTTERHRLVQIHGPMQFQLGSPVDEPDRTNRERSYPCVINRNYAISTHEVTHKQFKRFLDETNHVQGAYNALEPAFPQTGVSWYSAAAYCNWLSEKCGIPKSERCFLTGKDGRVQLKRNALQLRGYRLPTEAEWEYACRAQTTSSYSFGNDIGLLDDFGWGYENSNKEYQPVGKLAPNGFGLFDMHGNAAELCLNEFRVWQDDAMKSDDQFDYPYGIGRSFQCTNRGGSYFDFDRFLRSSARNPTPASSSYSSKGFRIARTIRASGRDDLIVQSISL
ncbi:MAG: formylglycine-generating enzyme family protein, partial [Planctomycetota bacterium]